MSLILEARLSGAGFGEVCASLMKIPEDVSVRKPPLKEEARWQRTLTLENDGFF